MRHYQPIGLFYWTLKQINSENTFDLKVLRLEVGWLAEKITFGEGWYRENADHLSSCQYFHCSANLKI